MLAKINELVKKNKNKDREFCQKAIAQAIKESNAEFNALSPAKKRIAIAKDVIANVKSHLINVVRGRTNDVTQHNDDIIATTPGLVCGLINKDVSCACCAVGSMLTSTIISSKLASEQLIEKRSDMTNAINALSKYWPAFNLMLIEIAFEKGMGAFVAPVLATGYYSREDARTSGTYHNIVNITYDNHDDTWYGYKITRDSQFEIFKNFRGLSAKEKIKRMYAAERFNSGDLYTERERLIKIMENVIKNNGLFVPK